MSGLDFVAGSTQAPIIGYDSDVGYTFGSGTAGSLAAVRLMQTETSGGDYDLGTDDFAIYMFVRSANIAVMLALFLERFENVTITKMVTPTSLIKDTLIDF